MSIDVYDPKTLFALLEWAERVGAGAPPEEPVEGGAGEPAEERAEVGPAGELGEVEIPEWARGNPWLAVIAKRG